MEKVRPWCGQPSDRGRLKNRTEKFTSWYGDTTEKLLRAFADLSPICPEPLNWKEAPAALTFFVSSAHFETYCFDCIK